MLCRKMLFAGYEEISFKAHNISLKQYSLYLHSIRF